MKSLVIFVFSPGARKTQLPLDDGYRCFQFQHIVGIQFRHEFTFPLWEPSQLLSCRKSFSRSGMMESASVAAQHQPHVAAHIIFVIESAHLALSRIFQVGCAADDGIFVGRTVEHPCLCSLQRTISILSEYMFSLHIPFPVLLGKDGRQD